MFWDAIPEEYRDRVVDVIEDIPQHQYQVLTKRPTAMLAHSRRRPLPANFWAGVSIELQQYAGRLEILRQVEATIRFLSLEPLLGPLHLDYSGIEWVIVGGESGPHVNDVRTAERRALVRKVGKRWQPRMERANWVRVIRDDCLRAGVSFFFKQWGGPRSKSGGRELDGQTWDETPSGVTATV